MTLEFEIRNKPNILSFRITEEINTLLKKLAQKNNLSKSEIARQLIEKSLKEEK